MDFEVFLGYFTGLRFLDETIGFPALVGTTLFVHFLDGIACGLMAKRNRRPLYPWVVSGLLFGIWALTLLLLLVIRGKGEEMRERVNAPFNSNR